MNKLFRAIEGVEFAAQVSVASTLSVLLSAIARRSETQELLSKLKITAEQLAVLRRLLELVSVEIDYRYQNPLDIALSTYLWCLKEAGSPVAKIAASAAVRARNTLWTPIVAEEMLKEGVGRDAGFEMADFSVKKDKRKIPSIKWQITDATESQALVLMLPASSRFGIGERKADKPSSGNRSIQSVMRPPDLFAYQNPGAFTDYNTGRSLTVTPH